MHYFKNYTLLQRKISNQTMKLKLRNEKYWCIHDKKLNNTDNRRQFSLKHLILLKALSTYSLF